jgi:hypothetical protein
MQVTADSAFTAVHQCQLLEVTAGAVFHGDIATYLLRSGAAVSPADDDAERFVADLAKEAEPAEAAPDSTPDPTDELDITAPIDQVLAWVRGDGDRALAAFTAEEARGDRARKTLLDTLTKIVEG